MNFVAIDFETANERRDSACAIGITRVVDGVPEKALCHLIRPVELRFEYMNTQIHGITARDVARAPTMRELWPEIASLIEGQLVVAHNAAFDMGVLRQSFHAAGVKVPRVNYLCSLKVARRAWPELASHRLNDLANYHDLALDHHHAGSDSLAAAELLLIAGRTGKICCPRELAKSLGVSIGEVRSENDWTPSSALKKRRAG